MPWIFLLALAAASSIGGTLPEMVMLFARDCTSDVIVRDFPVSQRR